MEVKFKHNNIKMFSLKKTPFNHYLQGTITDDSDIWLFGGSRVYKNFFDQEKYVEFFNGNELITHFGLTRDKLGKVLSLV